MEKEKKVAIIGIVGVPANYGGYETMVDNMLDYTPKHVKYTVYCSKKAYKEYPKEYKGAKLKYLPFKANGVQALIYDACSILNAYFKNDVIITLGTAGTYVLPLLKLIKKKKIILNYDGHETTRDKFGVMARLLLSFLRKNASRMADVHIADNDAIAPLVKKLYGVDSVVIEYGGDGAFTVKDDQYLKERYGLEAQKYYFNVARIEPENNIHLMLEAFKGMPDKKLVLVGNWHKNQYGEGLLSSFNDCGNIIMLDPIYEKKDINLLRSNCKLYIHPHSVGGTNPSLVEAMYLGLDIVAFDVVYNRATTENKARYFKDVNELVALIKDESMPNGKIMHEIAQRRYTWKIISDKYTALY